MADRTSTIDHRCPDCGGNANDGDHAPRCPLGIEARALDLVRSGQCALAPDGETIYGWDILRESPIRKAVSVGDLALDEGGHYTPVTLDCGHVAKCNATMMHRVGQRQPCIACGEALGRAVAAAGQGVDRG